MGKEKNGEYSMKDRLIKIIESQKEPLMKLNIGREYLQEFILYINFMRKFAQSLIFEGGTALRIIYGLKRFSEDLDFSAPDYPDISLLRKALEQELFLAGYKVEIAEKQKGNLYHLRVKFIGLDELLMLSYGKKLTISLEIDLSPPSGGKTEKSIAGKEVRFRVKHYELSSLFAKKLHAVIFRGYIKGRDFYDLLWYMTKKPPLTPDEELFLNAVAQTHPKELKKVEKMGWEKALMEKILSVNFKKIREDVAPFLENSGEINLLTKETFLDILEKR